MKKIFTLLLAVTFGYAMAQEFTFTGSTLPSGWTASNKGSSSYEGESGNVLKVSDKGVITYVFDGPINLESIDFTFAFKTKETTAHADIVVKDASDAELATAQLFNTAASGVKEEANVAIAANGVKTFIITNVSGQNFLVSKIKFNAPSCTPPSDPLALKLDTTKSETEGLYVGDKIKLTITGTGNGEAQVLTLDDKTFSETEWTAVAGVHTFVLSQKESSSKVCGTEIEVKLNVAEKTPVTAAAIKGDATVAVNKELVLTCEAANATNWQWYKGTEKIDGATEATYTFKPTEVGDVTFSCEAWNQFNNSANPAVKSEGFKVTVTAEEVVCGILIKASRSGKKKATVDASSVVGGTAETNMEKDKLEKKYYFGVTLAEGTFAEGDVFIMNITTAPGAASEMGTMKVYADKGGSEKLFESEVVGVVGENKWKLPAAVNGKQSLYIYRPDGNDWNPTFSYIAVKRKCPGESSEATVSSLKINGQEVTAEGGVYSIELPADYKEEQIEITFELAAGATADKKNPMQILVPEPGKTTETTITVTSQDGENTVTYTIKISRAAAPKSTDASITELKINNTVVKEVNAAFAYEVMADVELDSVEVAFELAEKATAVPGSPFKMLVPEPGAAATEATVKVTAEDGTTTKDYTVKVLKAKKADEAIEDVQSGNVQCTKVVENGQLFILKNGIKYNAQGVAVF